MNGSLDNGSWCFNGTLVRRPCESCTLTLVAIVVNLVLALPANAYVLWAIAKGGRESVTSDYFALNLSVTETLQCLLSAVGNIINHRDLFYASISCIYVGRSLFHTLMCVERYVAVVRPVVYLRRKSLANKAACSALAWLAVLASTLTWVFVRPTFRVLHCSLSGVIVVSFLVNAFCCQAILRALKRPRPGEGNPGRGGGGTDGVKVRAFRMLLVYLVSSVISYTPAIIIMLLEGHLNRRNTDLARAISFSFTVLYGFTQPLLHFYKIGKLPCKG